MGTAAGKQPRTRITGTATDMSLVDAWLRGVLQSVYGSRWEAIYKRTPARFAFEVWAGLTIPEA
jgi:hypothetical protein